MCSHPSVPGAALWGAPARHRDPAAPDQGRLAQTRHSPGSPCLCPGLLQLYRDSGTDARTTREAQQLGLPQLGAVREAPARKMAGEELPLRPPELLIGQLTHRRGHRELPADLTSFLGTDVTQPRKLNGPSHSWLLRAARERDGGQGAASPRRDILFLPLLWPSLLVHTNPVPEA